MVDFPISLQGIFSVLLEDEESRKNEEEDGTVFFQQVYEESTVTVVGTPVRLRQFVFHRTNANQVWPATFTLASFLLPRLPELRSQRVLEMGAATGILSIWLRLNGVQDITTTDYNDIEDPSQQVENEIEGNLRHNCALNEISPPLPHVRHTWGTPWACACACACGGCECSCPRCDFDVLVGSDLLLYVSAYAGLVRTLTYLMKTTTTTTTRRRRRTKESEFIMAWNPKRLPVPDRETFFTMMLTAGFRCDRPQKNIYIFTLPEGGGGNTELKLEHS